MTLPILQQEPPTPLSSDGVIDLVTALVADITGLAPTLVRPRWQPTPPAQPPAGTDWCGVGIMSRSAQDYTYQVLSTLPGTDTEALLQQRWGELDVLVSFYGPNCDDLAEQLRDGLYVTQNLESLYAYGIKLARVGDVSKVPDLVNVQWIDHCDLPIWLARQLNRYYPLQSVVKAVGNLKTDVGPHVDLDSDEAAPLTP